MTLVCCSLVYQHCSFFLCCQINRGWITVSFMLQVTDFLPHRSFSALLPSATKLRKGNVFTSVCHSVHGGWQTPPWADTPLTSTCWDTPPAQCMLGYTPLPTATAADGTHPSGMHSCSSGCFHTSFFLHQSIYICRFSVLNYSTWRDTRCVATYITLAAGWTEQQCKLLVFNNLREIFQGKKRIKLTIAVTSVRKLWTRAEYQRLEQCTWNLLTVKTMLLILVLSLEIFQMSSPQVWHYGSLQLNAFWKVTQH